MIPERRAHAAAGRRAPENGLVEFVTGPALALLEEHQQRSRRQAVRPNRPGSPSIAGRRVFAARQVVRETSDVPKERQNTGDFQTLPSGDC